MPSSIVLLGPQRFRPTLATALRAVGVEGDVALVTAGWREREDEDDELRAHLTAWGTVNLRLFARAEEAFGEDPELLAAFLHREERLRQLQAVMSIRLEALKRSAETLLRRPGEEWLLGPEREEAFADLRDLDDRHAARVRKISEDFDAEVGVRERPSLVRHREEIAERIAGAGAVLIAGGHVGVILTRMLLFGVADAIGDRPVVAWSAGAMAVSGRVVLFPDRPPQGPGTAEILSPGLTLLDGVVAFPDARRRLNLDDPVRVSLLSRRFAPLTCLSLDDGTWARYRDGEFEAADGAEVLLLDGRRAAP